MQHTYTIICLTNSTDWLSYELGHIRRHLIYLRRIILLDVAQNAHVLGRHEVDGDTLAAETTRPTDPMNVELSTLG